MKVLDYLKNNIVYLDGGMGTLLQKNGLGPGELPERWNLTHPEVVRDIHKAYFDAGSNIVCTNTFGANVFKFSEEELEQIISSAIANVREAAAQSTATGEKYVALDIGSLGKLLKPYGDLAFDEAVEIFSKTVKLGEKYGVDLIFIETMNDSYETKAALLAAKENTSLPVFVSNAYGEDKKLMTGADPRAMVAMLEGMGADAIGANCSLGPAQLKEVVDDYLKYASVPVLLKPNAGLPRSVNNETVYDVFPEEFSEVMREYVKRGIRLAGGCCGTTPEYIRELVEATKDLDPVPVTDKGLTLISSYTHAVEFGKEPVLIGERINPTGKKKFKEALRNNDIDYILGEGLKQQDKGAHVLDVNVGLPEIDEAAMIEKVCFELQAIIDLPLQIDTTNIAAMETALRHYNGKAMINSVNGKQEVMDAIFPLVKKYGGLVVCLTLDEEGIPESAEKRVEIAKRIIGTAEKYGISKKDLIFDTLTMTVSADSNAALATLGSLNTISRKLGCCTSLGVSNVSFGLPNREIITSTFFALALENGLSAAIMNPNSAEMMKVYYSFKALHGMDVNCMEYIEKIPGYAAAAPVSNAPAPAKGEADIKVEDELSKAIVKGLREKAAALTEKLLETEESLDIVNGQIIPALDIVGQGFEKKTLYLPQLMMSAEAAQCAFEKIKAKMENSPGESVSKGKCIVATVKGDIHDIGKNIVKLILENYGFSVIDLGRDVDPELIVSTAINEEAPVVGLSALMTTTVPAMEETIKLLKEKAPNIKTVVGGAVLTQEYADRIGADFYAKDAMATVRYALSVVEK
ncbi:MAG: homocysteine S-methyltransferase family protein [Clostridiales bacterium]|nr:homocysteine S-methyltransferase family protein [Clostridiales bacterium]